MCIRDSIYYVTGQFTIVILVSFVLACGLAEITRVITHYRSRCV